MRNYLILAGISWPEASRALRDLGLDLGLQEMLGQASEA